MSDYPPILPGQLMCYRCRTVLTAPPDAKSYTRVTCTGCGAEDAYEQHRCHPDDPLRNKLGWPYDDPTVPYDC